MKITEIKQQQKREDRCSIYVDGKYRFSLSQAEVTNLGLHQDQELTEKELAGLQQEAVMSKAYDRALRYISIRPRSEYEIRTYLKRKDYQIELINAIVEKLYTYDLLDDTKFAHTWIGWRLNSKPSSKRKLFVELKQKGIDSEIINDVLAEIDRDTEVAQIKLLIERKKRLSQYQDPQKLMAYLARQGFSYDQIKQALAALENWEPIFRHFELGAAFVLPNGQRYEYQQQRD